MTTNYCCSKMKLEQKEIRYEELIDHSIVYNKRYREFFIYFNEEAEQRGRELLTQINYCPWCGIKFPGCLNDKWWEILEKEYGIEDPRDSESNKVPPEFWTDEWWKKRGL